MRLLAAITVLLAAACALAQEALPSAPSATQAEVQQQQFMSQVDPPALSPRPMTLSASDKFDVFLSESASPLTLSSAAASAGVAYRNPAFGGYWRRYGVALADSESNLFFAKFLIPMLAHQDPRYKPSGRESFFPRVLDAMSQIIDTTTDDGEPQFNYSHVLGVVVSDSIANAYYPPGQRGLRHTGIHVARTLSTDAGMNVVREFLPDVKQFLFGRHISTREREALSWHTGEQQSVEPVAKRGALTRR